VRHSRLRHPATSSRTVGPRHVHALRLPRLESAHGRILPRQTPAHRALRLGVAAATAAAGLGLVIGLLTLVVALGDRRTGPNRSRTIANSSHTARPLLRQPPGPGGSALRAGAVLAAYRGAGSARSVKLRVRVPATWGLSWSYRCTATRNGSFTVRDGAGSSGRLVVATSGPRGQGLSWVARDPGDHQLVVVSDCPWAVKVVRPAALSLGPQQDHSATPTRTFEAGGSQAPAGRTHTAPGQTRTPPGQARSPTPKTRSSRSPPPTRAHPEHRAHARPRSR